MVLKKMTDYVLEIMSNEPESKNFSLFTDIKKFKLEAVNKIFKYAQFLKQPLTLGMFVPCDEDGSVLEEPFYDPSNEQYWASESYQYQQAKERVLFEGWVIDYQSSYSIIVTDYKNEFKFFIENNKVVSNGSIEDFIRFQPTLTQSAEKQLKAA